MEPRRGAWAAMVASGLPMNSRTSLSVPLVVAVAACAAASGCGDGVHNLDVASRPLVVVHGHVDLSALSTRSTPTAPLLGTLVWAAVPSLSPICLEFDDTKLKSACPDPYGVFQSIGTGGIETPVTIDGDGNFDISLFHLPVVRVSVGDGVTRIAYAALMVFEDLNSNGLFDFVGTVGGGPDRVPEGSSSPVGTPDTILASTFSSLRSPQQRIVFREGGFDRASNFYPITPPVSADGNSPVKTFPDACVPPDGFSVLSTPGYAASAACVISSVEGRLELPMLSRPDASALMCRPAQRDALIRQPEEDQQETATLCLRPAGKPDREILVTVFGGTCPHLRSYALKGCSADALCDTPEWDLTSSPPTWWRTECPSQP